jgi:hypothetical protein
VNDAYAKLLAGELKLLNNVFFKIGSFTTLDATSTGIIRVSSSAEDATAAALVNHLTTNQTSLFSPYIRAISRTQNAQLDPRPCVVGSAYATPRAALPAGDPFFSNVDFKGAFSADWNNLWLRDWSTLARNGHLPASPVENCPTVNTDEITGGIENAIRIFPNPASELFVVESTLEEPVSMEIFDLAGRLVSQRLTLATGMQQVYINELSTGMYLVRFRAENGKTATMKLIVE